MSEEYEIIFITEEGRAIINKKTRKVYHSEFEIIEEKDKEIDRLNNIINECMESVSCIEHNLEKYEEIGLDHFDYALEKTRELKEYLYEELKENNK